MLERKLEESKSFFISTYGCQMNVNDTERATCLLEMSGYVPVSQPSEASLIIVNSCSIREKPVHKVRSEIGRYKKLKASNKKLRIGVMGCVAQQEKTKLLKQIPLLDFVVGTDAIDEIPAIVNQLEARDSKKVFVKQRPKEPYHVQTLIRNTKVTAFVNISKGCDNFCTFCVVPFTRGRERSRPLSHLIEDINNLCDRGVKEVTLLGQNVNSYRSDCGAHFGKLLKTLSLKTPIERIRFITSHPKDFNEELVDIIQEHRNKIMDFIHLPAQSGNTEVLKRMNRGYSREEYIEKALMVLEKIPNSSLSTDIIVGFPGETEKQFQDTLSLIDQVPYETMFSFKYSSRPYTKAAFYEDQIPEKEKSIRLSLLQDKHEKIAFQLAKKYKDKVLSVLVEKKDSESGLLMGRSTQNKSVYFAGAKKDIGRTLAIKINTVYPGTLYGDQIA